MFPKEEEFDYDYGQSSSDQGEGVLPTDDPPLFHLKTPKLVKEILTILSNAIPLSSCLVLSYFPNVLNIYFISKTNDLIDICLIGLILILVNISGYHFLCSLNNEIGKAIEQLNNQPYFSFHAPYNKYTIGLYFHRGIILGTILIIPWFIFLGLFNFFGHSFFENQTFFTNLNSYLIFLLPSIYFNFGFDLTRNLLTSLNVLKIPCTFLVLTIFLHYLFCFLFQVEGNFSLKAASFCKNITDFLNAFLLLLYAWNLRSLMKIWIPWTSNSFSNLFSHIDFGNLLKNYLELLIYEIMNILIFCVADLKELAPYLIIICIQSMNIAIDMGLAQTILISINNCVKEGAINKAKNKFFLGIVISLIFGLTQWLFFFLLKSIVEKIMLKEDLVKNNFQNSCDYYIYKIFLDSILLVSIGVLKGLQKFHISFYLHCLVLLINLIIYVYLKLNNSIVTVSSLWEAFIISQMISLVLVIVYLVFIINWKNEINQFCLNKIKKNLNKT